MIIPKLNALIVLRILVKIVLHAIKLGAKCADKAFFTMKMATTIMSKMGPKRSRKGVLSVSMITALLAFAETCS